MIFSIFKFIPKDLKIHFVDIGQGDCTFIETPYGKTILIDGGGSSSKDFDVGKSTLLPYVLDRGYTSIDYVFISHFDQDHVRFYPTFATRNKSKKDNNWKAIWRFGKLSKIVKISKRTKCKSAYGRSGEKN